MTTMSEVKSQAHILKDFLKQKFLTQKNYTLSLGSCFQAISKINGFKDWNTMSAYLSEQEKPTSPPSHKPNGDMFDSNDKLVSTEAPEDSPNLVFRRASDVPVDFSAVVEHDVSINLDDRYPKKYPSLELSDDVRLDNHPKLIKLANFIGRQKPVANPRVFLLHVKEIVGTEYYVGWGGEHIHIKTADKQNILAMILPGALPDRIPS
ncbi:MAG: hypothetical protein ACNA7Y_00065 [Gammaproteobacteria bacterium]